MHIGGSHILTDSTLQIYGDVQLLYEIDSPILVQKFSRLKFSLNVIQASEKFVVCLYEKSGVADEEVLVGNEYRCANVTNFVNIEVNIGSFFDDRTTEINAISFAQINPKKQRSGESELNNLTIESGDQEEIFDSNGNCNDINAYKVEKDEQYPDDNDKCVCVDTYVASNGGKILGEYDSCVPCLGCALDGEACVRNRDCMIGACSNETCVPGVSYMCSQYLTSMHPPSLLSNHFNILSALDWQYVTIICQEKYGESNTEPIKAVLLDLEEGETINNDGSGISVQIDGTTRLYGNVERLYQLSRNVTVTKFKRMSFTYTHVVQGTRTQNAAICIYEKLNNSTLEDEDCPPLCYTPEEGQNTIDLGGMFHDRITSIQCIGFTQISGISEFRDIYIFSDPEEDLINANDECADPNARRVRRLGPIGCSCMDGYVSSNGGKLQGKYDTCLSCIDGCASSNGGKLQGKYDTCLSCHLDSRDELDISERDECATVSTLLKTYSKQCHSQEQHSLTKFILYHCSAYKC